MTKFRAVVLAGLIGFLVVLAPPAQAATPRPSSVVSAAVFAASPQVSPVRAQTAPPGPVLDPNGTTEADAKQTKNKIIAAGIAIVLAFLVWWGRRVRSKKAKSG